MRNVPALCVSMAVMLTAAAPASAADAAENPCAIASQSRLPTVDVRGKGAIGNGETDDTAAIEAALAEVQAGGTVFFPPGTYRHDGVIIVNGRNVTLTGDRATLLGGNPAKAAVVLAGEGASILNMTVTVANPGQRGAEVDESAIVVKGSGNAVVGTTVSHSRSAGIFLQNAAGATVACNQVFDTLADGIHATDGSTGGVIRGNSVRNTGDDGIAIVSYAKQLRATTGMVVHDNDVSNIRWGRGISVIGSANAIIENNRVSGIAMAAGIIVAREAAFDTPGASDVLIRGNHIENVQYKIAPREGAQRTGHAAIELNSDSYAPAMGVSRVIVTANSIIQSGYDGIRILGNVSDVAISANVMSAVKDRPILVISDNPAPVTECDGNRYATRAIACG